MFKEIGKILVGKYNYVLFFFIGLVFNLYFLYDVGFKVKNEKVFFIISKICFGEKYIK